MSTTTAWVLLVTSGLVDVLWAIAMKTSDGFAQPAWSAVSLVLLGAFVVLLTRALQVLPVGTAYAVWTGIGAAGSVAAGILVFGEPATTARLLWIAVVVIGVVGLKTAGA